METTETQITLSNVTTVSTFEPAKVDDLLKSIRESALAEVFDCSTAKGIADCKSHAHKVSKSKVHLVNLAKDSVAEASAIVKAVTVERRRIEVDLDALRDEVKKPAVEAEAKEQARKDGHRAVIDRIKLLGSDAGNLDELEVDICLKELKETFTSLLEEFEEEADREKIESNRALYNRRELLEERAKQAAELARLQQKEADDKARIQKLEADAAAAKQKLIDDAAALKAKEDKIAADKQALVDAEKAAAEKKEREEKEAADREAAAVQRDKDVAAAAVKAEQDKQTEAKRVADQKIADDAEKARLAAADKEHRAKVINQAINAIHDGANDSIAISKDQAAVVVELITAGFVPAITINF